MTTDEFAGKIKQKYPQYQSLDNQTLTSKMLAKYPQYKSQVDVKSSTPISDAAYKIPVVGGLAKAVVQPVEQLAGIAGKEQGLASGPFFGLNLPAGTKTMLGMEKSTQSQDPVSRAMSVLGPQIGTATTALTALDAPAIVTGVKNAVTAIPKYITKGTTYKTMAQAASKGGDINWETVASAARDQVKNLGTGVKKELEKLIAEETPTMGNKAGTTLADKSVPDAVAKLTSPQALELRAGLGQRMPGSFFENVMGKVMSGGKSIPRNQAIDALRRTVSAELKKAAPDILTPDKMYAFYSKIGGDAPTWAKRAILFEMSKFVKDKMGLKGPTSDVIDAIASIYAGGKF